MDSYEKDLETIVFIYIFIQRQTSYVNWALLDKNLSFK